MVVWKKIIVSGSQAELAGATGSFTGSFFGDGSGLSGLSSFSVSGDTNNRVITADGSGGGVGEANLTFDGSRLGVTGTINASGTITGSGLQLTSVPAGTDNTVLVLNSAGGVVTDEIDSRVWGSTLVDGSGLAPNYVTFASDSDTITGASDFTYNSGTQTLTVTNATITGDLVVQGTTTELQVTNLNIEDQFILLNSGSAGADTGIIFGGTGGTPNQGAALYFDNNDTRLSFATGVSANATTATTAGYITIAFDVDTAGHTPVAEVGNIRIEGGEAFIYA